MKPGEDITIFVFIGVNNTVELTSFIGNGQDMQIEVGTPVVDFTSTRDTRRYVADLSQYLTGPASINDS